MTKARDLANSAAAFADVSATELGYVDGVTSAIQTQMDAKAPSSTAVTLTGTQTLTNKTLTSPVIASVINNTLTSTTGDIIYASGANTPARLGIGSSAQVLTVASGVPSWATPSSGGMTLLSTTTTNTGSAYTVSSIDQTYVNLLIIWQGLSCTDGSFIRLDFASGNSSGGGVNSDGTAIAFNAASAKLMPDTQAYGNAISCLITNYTAAAEKNLQIAFGGVATGWRGGGYQGFNSYNAAISTFTVTLSSGSFSAGSLKLYGVK